MSVRVPELPGLLDRHEVARTAAAIARVQEPDGSVPWSEAATTDVWNHVEAAMGMLVGGQVEAAERAYDWCLATQRADGSWPMHLRGGVVEDASGETNMSAYLAVGVWHHWLVRQDPVFVRRCWPAVRRGLGFVVGLQQPFGGVAWSREAGGRVNEGALLAGSSSIHHALRAGLALSGLVDDPQPEWELAAGRLGHALRRHPDLFLDKATYSMDWYYPVLGGAVRGDAARALLASRWEDFVVPGLGIRCVDTNPWVTGAETCELALALDALGDRAAALTLLRDMQHLRDGDGGYWTGYVFPDDALSTGTPGSDLFRGAGLPGDFPEIGLECGCSTAHASQRVG